MPEPQPSDDPFGPRTELSFVDIEPSPGQVEPEREEPSADREGSRIIPELEAAAALQFLPTDSPQEVVSAIHEAGGTVGDKGGFIPQAGQIELLTEALEGNANAYERVPQNNGLRLWVDCWRTIDGAAAELREFCQPLVADRDTETFEELLEEAEEPPIQLPSVRHRAVRLARPSRDTSEGHLPGRLLDRLRPSS